MSADAEPPRGHSSPRSPRRRARRRQPPERRHDLGLLFVHGIGEQERGATLVTAGEALHAWLHRWFRGITRSWRAAGLADEQLFEWQRRRKQQLWQQRGEERALPRFEALRTLLGNMRTVAADTALPPLETVRNDVAGGILAATASLRDPHLRDGDEDAPAHAPLELLAIGTDGKEHRSRWLLGESWWAQAFTEPTFRQLALWLVQALPWTLGRHYGSRVGRAWRRARPTAGRNVLGQLRALPEVLANLVLLVLATPFAVVAQAILLLLVLVALLPIARLRAALAGLERTLAATLGDSLVLLSSPLQQAAMVAQIRRDAAWLATRCKRVAIVAHSQGAALAHMAMRDERPPNVALLLTCGSGLRKLEELRQMSASEEGLAGRAYLSAAGVVLLAASAAGAISGLGWNPWTTAVGLLLFALVVVSYLGRYTPIDISWYSTRFQMEGLHWVDYYATNDPVPNGALQDYEEELVLPLSVPIVNERSLLRDHTTYWRNPEQFVGLVAGWAAQLVDGPWQRIVAGQRDVWVSAQTRRRWRVAALAAARWIGFASAVALVWARRAEWRALLAWLLSLAGGAVDELLPWFSLSRRAARPELPVLAVTAGALFALIAIWQAARFAWARWSEHELRLFFDRDDALRSAAPAPAGARWRRFVAAAADVARFDAQWFFFAFGAAQVALAAIVARPLPTTIETWLDAGTAASVAGFAAAAVFSLARRRAVAGAVARAAAQASS